jgi:tetratricopeptide (TPR) repeat protein
MNASKEYWKQICLADERGQIAVVVELCKKYLHKFPNDGFAWVWYGMAQTKLFRYVEAEKAVQRAIKLCPKKGLPVAYVQMGEIYKGKGNFEKAAFWYLKALKQKPQDATYHLYLGHNAFKHGLFKQAKKYFRSALKCSEGCLDEACFNLGGILLGERNYSEAVKCYEESLKIDPKNKITKERLDDAKLALLIAESK